MSLIEKVPALSNIVSNIKDLIFGENNSRLDLLLDYFFSLRQEKRARIVIYSIFTVILLTILAIVIYFIALHNLQKKLEISINNVTELNKIQPAYLSINQEFTRVTDILKSNNQFSSISSKLDQKTKDLDVNTNQIPDKPILVDLPSSDPLSSQFQKAQISYKLLNISLRKMINYINTIEQMENRFKVTKLEIHQKFGTKLYFDASITVEVYIPDNRN